MCGSVAGSGVGPSKQHAPSRKEARNALLAAQAAEAARHGRGDLRICKPGGRGGVSVLVL